MEAEKKGSKTLKLGLALSGGGFRATLFHLGVIRFLKDADVLHNVEDIASVSGGSILAAHLVLNWDRYNGDEAAFSEAVSEILKFVQFDLRNHIVRRLPLQLPLRLMARMRLIEGKKFTANALLERYYKNHLFGDRCLYELPENPRLHILATSVSTGVLSAFNREGLFIQKREENSRDFYIHIPGRLASIPMVVGASSAFPGFFPPVQITAADLGVREGEFSTEYFTDGGVYDNLGLRAFLWLRKEKKKFDHILVSDAGKPFQILTDAALGFIGQSVRASDILWDRVWQLERENFGHQEGFLFLPITELVDRRDDPTALNAVVQAEVQSIRTDLDKFSDREINALAQHGYEVARKLCRQNNILGRSRLPDTPPWAPIPAKKSLTEEAKKISAGAPAEPTRWARQLRDSSRRRVWSTLLDWRDWPSYLYLAIAFVLFFYLPLQVYQLYKRSVVLSEVIDSIASGDPDVNKILELSTSDPTSNWVSEEVHEKPKQTEVNFEGVEVVTHSRFYDLRRWHPDEELLEDQGKVYIFDRVTLKFLKSYKGDHHITFSIPTALENLEFRFPNDKLRGTISRVIEPVEVSGQKLTVYEFDYDLPKALPEEMVTIEVEVIANAPKTTRAPIMARVKTDLMSVWLLFPLDRPYKNYSLVSYPADRSSPPQMMKNRYAIDHPYGFLIGWSLVNPEVNRIYECRWTY